MDRDAVARILDAARAAGREVLLEPEGLALLEAVGLTVPAHLVVADAASVDAALLAPLPGDRVVVKAVAAGLHHKSDRGGVAVAARNPAAVAAAVASMAGRFAGDGFEACTVHAFVPHDEAFGHELLLGLRWTDDAGPVVSVGAGGLHAEFLSAALRPGREMAFLSPSLAGPGPLAPLLAGAAVVERALRPMRGRAAPLEPAVLEGAVRAFLDLAAAFGPRIAEAEVNPLVVGPDGGLVALDVLVRLRDAGPGPAPAPRPLRKLRRLLEPRTVAVLGVSKRRNPGRIIVENLLADGFDGERVFVVKPGGSPVEGCRSVATLADLPERVDLLVLCIDAAGSAAALEEVVAREAAETVVLLAGGLEEKEGGGEIAARMRRTLEGSRGTAWGGPLVNGGNCLGVRSRPGRVDTLFIPRHKLPGPRGKPDPVVLLSQSGAFAVARASKLGLLDPRYVVTVGNQMDLTVGDWLVHLAGEPGLDLFAVYVEGFRPLDGLRFLEAARGIAASGRTVLLYRSGRTAAGARASVSHTGSIAGEYAVFRALAERAGVVVADTLEEFEDLALLFALLGRPPRGGGLRLGCVTNAGFEAVAMADNLGPFTLPPFSPATAERVRGILDRHRLGGVVDVHNPLDLTPITPDGSFAEAVEAVLADGAFDAAVVGCVPLSGALQTLAPGPGHDEDAGRTGGLVDRLARLRRQGGRPWVAVVDAGAPYDPMARLLAEARIPVFRTADRALRRFARYLAGGPRPVEAPSPPG